MTFHINVTSDRIQYALYGFTRSQILFTALDLDVFTHLAQGHDTLDKLLDAVTADERGLRILLDGLIGIGFLQKDGNRYCLTDDAEKYLVKDAPEYMGGMVNHCKRLYENWMMLTDAVKNGQPVGGAQSLNQLEAYFSELIKGLYVSNYPTARRLAKVIGIGETKKNLRILDVAGGSGVWSIAMLERDLQSRGVLLDFETVIHVAKDFVTQHDLMDRFEFWPEDLEDFDFPEDDFDMAILGNICHAIGPYATDKLIRNMGKTLKPGGHLVIVDFLPDDARSQPGWPLIFGVNMLIATPEGDVFTESEYADWLAAAGFKSHQRYEIDFEVSVIVAER